MRTKEGLPLPEAYTNTWSEQEDAGCFRIYYFRPLFKVLDEPHVALTSYECYLNVQDLDTLIALLQKARAKLIYIAGNESAKEEN
jgi:hypothetical protein